MSDAASHYCSVCDEAPCRLTARVAAENARIKTELEGMQQTLDGFREDLKTIRRWNAMNRMGPLGRDHPLVRSRSTVALPVHWTCIMHRDTGGRR